MPCYDYRCDAHGTFEVECSIRQYSLKVKCPQCQKQCARHYSERDIPRVGGLSDTAYNRGYCNGNQFANDEETGDFLKRRAEKAGVSIAGKVYRHALAEYHGDPEAWTAGIDDARDLCKRRGYAHKITDGILDCKKDIPLSKADVEGA